MKISDTGPLIILYECSKLWILKDLYDEIIIPHSVSRELLRKPEGDKILNNKWIKVKKVDKSDKLNILRGFLDEGEAEAVAFAIENNSPILLDEKKGRRIAKSLGLSIQGTLGSLVIAKKRKLIESVRETVEVIINKGYYIDQELITEVLKISGEK